MIKFGWTTIFLLDIEAAFSKAEMYNPLTLHIVPAYCGSFFGYFINISHFKMITLFNLQDKLSCLLLVNSWWLRNRRVVEFWILLFLILIDEQFCLDTLFNKLRLLIALELGHKNLIITFVLLIFKQSNIKINSNYL